MRTLAIILLLASCSPVYYQIGMTEQDFLSQNKNKGVTVEEVSAKRTVYRKCSESVCYFFYFKDGVMYKLDKGMLQPDIIVESR